MKQKLVSIVVPVYNVEQYLPDCVDSILAQTYTNLQIILVDDGSKDASGEICDSYAKKDERICVIHQANQGAASARKNGVKEAEGEYLCFVDADDAVSPEMVQFLADKIGSCDMVTSGCEVINLKGQKQCRYDVLMEGEYKTAEEMEDVWKNMITSMDSFKDGILPFLFTKMYKTILMKSVIDSVDLSLVYAEDRDLLFRYILKCSSIRITHRPLYEYRLRSDSAVHSRHLDMLRNMDALYKSLEKAFEEHPKKDDLMRQLQMFLVSRMHNIPTWMGFCPEARMVRYLYQPQIDMRGKKIVLYGAGSVGKDYYVQIQASSYSEVVLWTDKKWTDYRESRYIIESPENVSETEFDYLLIAVKNSKLAEEIKCEWIEKGIPKRKILWVEPVVLEMR